LDIFRPELKWAVPKLLSLRCGVRLNNLNDCSGFIGGLRSLREDLLALHGNACRAGRSAVVHGSPVPICPI